MCVGGVEPHDPSPVTLLRSCLLLGGVQDHPDTGSGKSH